MANTLKINDVTLFAALAPEVKIDGKWLPIEECAAAGLELTDAERKRVTGGITLSLAKPFISDIRLNYEQYFYNDGATPKPSERNKIVVEVMTRF